MSNINNIHTFHIPVMGIGYTIDTPIKVAHLGISSAISLVDDILIERMRAYYTAKYNYEYTNIPDTEKDHRAKRITEYLNLVNKIVQNKFSELKKLRYEKGNELKKYFDILPSSSPLKEKLLRAMNCNLEAEHFAKWLDKNLAAGKVNVNIMTKLDRETYYNDEKLPVEFNDAHAALRGYANSDLESSLILSAGMNPRLFGYMENFDDFYPDESGNIKKKITLKISDYRSALIQGKYLAKKGLWISEYRVESGLNCGGHAFATDGNLLGPILEELKRNRESLIQTMHTLFAQALKDKKRFLPDEIPEVSFTAQGGIGTAEEHNFLLRQYDLDSIGWGTPLLLCPEVTNVDTETLKLLSDSKEVDLYLSNISPLGIPFNSLRNNTMDLDKNSLIEIGNPGSTCPKKFGSLNSEFTEKAICTGSRQYQYLKIKELNEKELSQNEYDEEYNKIVEKACICVGLGTSALMVNNINNGTDVTGVSVCPGPNMAYFSEIVSLKKMTDHIYARINLIKRKDRPNMFIKEIDLYVDYFKKMIEKFPVNLTEMHTKQIQSFRKNISEGITYYKGLFAELKSDFTEIKDKMISELEEFEKEINELSLSIVNA